MNNSRLILNKYLPLKEIGSGGFGTVFVCKDMLMQRLVAIKKIELTELDAQRARWVRDDMNRDAQVDALNAFETGHTTINLLTPGEEDSLAVSLERRYLANVPGLDEARMAAALSDPSIVAIYDCQIAGNMVYLVMEYVEGATLTQVLVDHNDEITLDVVSTVFESVSRALEVAHENGVLHFDIKPDNVIIDAQGNVKVTDFGLATLSDAQGEGTATAGTIGYMPLEQMRQEPLDARTDEWALASIVYEMLVGENPFLAPTLDQALNSIDGAELTLPSRCWGDLPDEVDDILFKALDPQKEDRYESVAEFADELIPLLGDADLGRCELAALGAAFPPVGALASLIVLSGALLACGAYVPGILLLAATGAWWWFVGRQGHAVANGLLGFPLFSAVGLAPVSALFTGYVTRIPQAVATTALGGLLCLTCAGFGSMDLTNWDIAHNWNFSGDAALAANVSTEDALAASAAAGEPAASGGALSADTDARTGAFANASDINANMVALVTNAGTWVLLASWILAALVMSLFARPHKRFMAVIGAFAGFSLIMIGIWLAYAFDPGAASMIPPTSLLVSAVISGALMIFATAALPLPES